MGRKKNTLIQINPLVDNFETELAKTKLMFADNWQPASFILMKINVDTNKGRSKTPVTPECNGENIRKQGRIHHDLQASLPGAMAAE